MPVEGLVGGAGAKARHADEAALGADPAVPPVAHAGFDGDLGKVPAEGFGAVFFRLGGEEREAGERDDAGADAFSFELLLRFKSDLDLRAGRDEYDLLFRLCGGEDVAAFCDEVVVSVELARGRKVLARQGDERGTSRRFERDLPGFGGFNAVGGATFLLISKKNVLSYQTIETFYN